MAVQKSISKKCDQQSAELVFILDRSGSMSGLEADTIGGFNSTLEEQREQPGECTVTTVLFDDKVEHLYDRVSIQDVKKLTNKEYYVRGCTALLDAMGETIKLVNSRQKKSPEGRPQKTIFVITTDGEENASRKFSLKEVRKLVEKRKEKNGWDFIFLGANIDAIETAGSLGIGADFAGDFCASEDGLNAMYNAVGCAVSRLRCDDVLSPDWKDGLK